MRRFWIILIVNLLAVVGRAQNATVTMTNGSVLHGYISAQRPGIDLTFHTTGCEIVASASELQILNEESIAFEQMSDGWKRWALGNHKLIYDSGRWLLPCYQVKLNKEVHHHVCLVERGISFKYVQYEEDEYVLSWNKIQKISNEENELSAMLSDEIALKNGRVYVGTIVEQNPPSNLKIKDRNGVVLSVDAMEIWSSRKVIYSPQATIWEARPYTNVIITKDRGKYDGFIVAQQFGESSEDNYLDLLKMNGSIQRIPLKDIQEYRYQKRDGGTTTKKLQLCVNGYPVKRTTFIEQNGIFYTTEDSSIGFPGKLPIQIDGLDITSSKGWCLVKLSELTFDKTAFVYGFKVNNMEVMQVDSQTLSGLSYSLLPNNKYVIINPQHTDFYIFEVGDVFYNFNTL